MAVAFARGAERKPVWKAGEPVRRAGRPARSGTPLFLQRQAAASRIEGSAATVSWIDPASPAGAQVSDPRPPATVTEAFLTGSAGFRFSNYLRAWIDVDEHGDVTGSGHSPKSDIYAGPSFAGIPSYLYPVQRSGMTTSRGNVSGVEFEQVAGARTISPGVIGGATGAAAGAGVGAWGGAKIGGAIGAAGGPIGAAGGAIIGGLIGLGVGYLAGTYAANRRTNFPPIWTRLRLRLFADGQRECELAEHSLFPSNSCYCDLARQREYNALAAEQSAWESAGWNAGNPWGVTRPTITP